MKKQMKRILMCMVMLTAIFITTGKPMKVSANDFTTAYELVADGKWSGDCYLEEGVDHYYKIELPTAGKLNIKIMSYIYTSFRYSYVEIYDDEFNYLGYTSFKGATSTAAVTESSAWTLSAGTYYVKFSTYDSDYEGNYKIYADFSSYGNDILVGGSDSNNASVIYLDKKIAGALTRMNKIDWFKIEVPVNGKYKYIFEGEGFYVTLYNSSLSKISREYGYSSNSGIVTGTEELSAGTYYVRVEKDGYGKYYYELRTVLPEKGEVITHTSSKNQYKVTKAGKTGGTVEFYRANSGTGTTVSIPDSVNIDGITYKVTGISENALEGNQKVKKVIIGKNVKTIGTRAFYGCSGLNTVTLKSGSALTTIKSKTFYECKKLSNITIPEKVTSIGKQAFYKCSKLKTITIKTTKLTVNKMGAKAFSEIHKKATIKVPKSKWNNYKKMLKKKGVSSTVAIKK